MGSDAIVDDFVLIWFSKSFAEMVDVRSKVAGILLISTVKSTNLTGELEQSNASDLV